MKRKSNYRKKYKRLKIGGDTESVIMNFENSTRPETFTNKFYQTRKKLVS